MTLKPVMNTAKNGHEICRYGLQVQVTHTGENKRTYKCQGLAKDGPGTFKFFNEQTEQESTVEQYFSDTYNLRYAFNRQMAA